MDDGSILGVWSLRSFHSENVDTGERSETFGPEPRGTLILHPGGWMSALITPGPTTVPEGGQAGGPPKLVAYSGRFRLEPPDRLVTSVAVAGFEAWIGTDQVRSYRLDRDSLELRTPPGRMPRPDGGEVTVVAVLTWTREAGTPATP